ncbi:Poly-beta-1,6-N-acetyl-D-glucosamine synthase [Anoxybacillus sp. BCO1]|nr:Poly-beta-1,6-N-acetyl-D-glucosamine synthase [Anoxybacillus sp. BCO1]
MIKLAAMFVFFFMIAVILFYTFLLVVSLIQLRRMYELDEWEPYEEMLDVSYTKPVSILVPAYNEEAGIFATVRSLLSIEYPEYEIVVINDGSTDDTLARLKRDFDLIPMKRVIREQLKTKRVRAVYRSRKFSHLFVIDKENGGKADALNAGINFSTYPYVCSIDGDSVIERRAFLKVMKPIVDSDEDVIASGGSVRIANGCDIEKGEVVRIGLSRHPLVIMQVIEYLRAFLMGRIGLSRHNLLLIVSGLSASFQNNGSFVLVDMRIQSEKIWNLSSDSTVS